jgi:hypothetical protein
MIKDTTTVSRRNDENEEKRLCYTKLMGKNVTMGSEKKIYMWGGG